MKRTYTFAQSIGAVTCALPTGQEVTVPVIPGILKHPTVDRLADLLKHPDVLRKYTHEALRVASWPVLRQFPRAWLRECLDSVDLTPARENALRFLLS